MLDKEDKLKRLTEILNEYVKFLHLYDKVKVELITKTHLETRTEFNYPPDFYGNIAIGNILGVEKILPTEFIRITYYECVRSGWESVFQSIDIPWEKIDKRIEHYENKIKYLKEKEDERKE